MTKMKLIVMLASLIVLAAVVILAVMYHPLLFMKPLKTGAVAGTPVTALKDGLGTCYFIKGEDGWLVIDAGSNQERMATSMEELGIEPREVTHLFLTHSDSDHVGGAALFEQAEVYAGKEEQPLIEGNTKRNTFSYNQLPSGIDTQRIHYVADGQQVFVSGMTVHVIYAPGHTNGHVCYLVDNRYLFSADAFSVSDGQLAVHPFSMNQQLAEKSIRHLKTVITDEMHVFTAHYGMFAGADLTK